MGPQQGCARLKVVIDTNVIVSALIGQGPPRRIHELWTSQHFRLTVSPEILNEYLRVLAYPKFRGSPEEAARLVNENILDHVQLVKPPLQKLPHPSRDPKDDMFLRAALAAKADWLVSGDKDLLSLNGKYAFQILGPADFLKLRQGQFTS
jgi:putative PIN family toxin of toxin-antitoxin system